MIMTLSLLIYATLECRIRTALDKENEVFPNQKGKPISNPTTRWVFQRFIGIHELTLSQDQVLIVNLTPPQLLILRLLGHKFQKIAALALQQQVAYFTPSTVAVFTALAITTASRISVSDSRKA